MKRVFMLWIILATAGAVISQEGGSAPYGPIPQQNRSKPRARLLPIGDALAFGSIGTGLVLWLRRRQTL